jgi:hypothetical protein
MWGQAKIVVKLREQGVKVSEATIGRIIAHLVKRGVVAPVPTIRKAAKTRKWSAKRRLAERLPKHLKATEPGQIVQIDTVYVTLAPGRHVKHFTAYDPVAKWTAAQAFERATATSAALFPDKLLSDMPFKVKGIQVDGGSELSRWNRAFGARPSSRPPASSARSSSTCCRPKAPRSTEPSSDATARHAEGVRPARRATSSTPSTTCPPPR